MLHQTQVFAMPRARELGLIRVTNTRPRAPQKCTRRTSERCLGLSEQRLPPSKPHAVASTRTLHALHRTPSPRDFKHAGPRRRARARARRGVRRPGAGRAVDGHARVRSATSRRSRKSLPGPPNDYFDPLNLATMTFDWGPQGEEATIGWLRHSEIKHGRVAMAGFLGFIAHCTPIVSGEHKFLPYRGYVAGVTPQEQWDNIPLIGKLQILIAIGMLESYGEGAGDPAGYTHYMKGGKPGYYPPIAGRAGFGQGRTHQPLGRPRQRRQVQRRRRRRRAASRSEILNGRAAMVGLMGLLSASSVPGSVPFLAGIEGFPRFATSWCPSRTLSLFA